MKVYFAHGLGGKPEGDKIKRLSAVAEEQGCRYTSIDYTDTADADLRVERLVKELAHEKDEFILVGSSMGGYVSLVAAEQFPAKGIFLMAPALFMPGYQKQTYANNANVEIVHGWSDKTIPPEHSIRYAQSIRCPLHIIPGDHRLSSSIDVIEKLFLQFLLSQRHSKA